MHAKKTLSQPSTVAAVMATSVCTVILTILAATNSNAVGTFMAVLLLIAIFAAQAVWYQSHFKLLHREQRFHRLGRKLVHIKAERKRDEALALKILNHINSTTDPVPDHARVWQKPLHGFSGDLALAYESACGRKYTLLADLTGHGIAAAIGAAPVASIFRATAKNGLSVEEITTEVNNRLQELLPSGFFCCAAIVMEDNGRVTACNAGLPDLLITNDDGDIVDSVVSEQIPLGIEPIDACDVAVFTTEYRQQHQLYAFTDGLIETIGANDEVFDIDVVTELVGIKNRGTGRISNITDSFETFSKGSALDDDISIVEVMIC